MTIAPSTPAPAGDRLRLQESLAEPPPRRASPWGMLGAAGFAAASGLALCVAVFISAAALPSVRPPPAPSIVVLAPAR